MFPNYDETMALNLGKEGWCNYFRTVKSRLSGTVPLPNLSDLRVYFFSLVNHSDNSNQIAFICMAQPTLNFEVLQVQKELGTECLSIAIKTQKSKAQENAFCWRIL